MPLLAIKREGSSSIQKAEHGAWSGEAVAFCPQCKAIQTLWIISDALMPTRKFSQYGARIYHDCGADIPCHLYRTS